jgi:predicted cupin superfamily sugar epimerase
MKADDLIRRLGLVPHFEGGFYKETYRSPQMRAGRSLATAIYYLLTPETCSRMHRLTSDEVFHFYAGDPVEMLQLTSGAGGRKLVLGPDVAGGQVPQLVVPAGVWQGSRLVAGGAYALLGATVSPGFDRADFTAGERAALFAEFPEHAPDIERLT